MSEQASTTSVNSPDTPGHTRLQTFWYHATGIVLRLFFRIWGRWEVIGLRENIPTSGPLLICANHASNVDPPLGWAAFYGYRRLRGVAKAELWKTKVGAYLLNAHDSISVARGAADRSMFRAVLEGLSRGDAIGLFPEGTRSYDGKLNLGQPGIGMLVQRSGVPVAPVAIIGTYQMMPRGRLIPKPAKIKIIFGAPIQFDRQTPREEIVTRIMAEIAALMTAHGVPMDPPDESRAAILADQAAARPDS